MSSLSTVHGIYDLDEDLRQMVAGALDAEPGVALAMLAAHGLQPRRYGDDTPIASPPLRALSLAVAQKCNLACSYCYAEGGSFRQTSRGTCHGKLRRRRCGGLSRARAQGSG